MAKKQTPRPTRRSAVHGPTTLERRWARILNEWKGSGQNARDFCRHRRLSESTFWFWKREIPDRERRRRRHGAGQSGGVRFLPVRVIQKLPSATALEVALGSRVIRIAGDFEPGLLRKLMSVLEAGP
jgi:hypothetical protein